MIDLTKYIGRSYEECDCFDLVKEFYKDHYNLDLCNYFDGQNPKNREIVESLIISNLGHFEKVEIPAYGDILVINIFGFSCHLGVYVGDGTFLHAARNVGSCIEPIYKILS